MYVHPCRDAPADGPMCAGAKPARLSLLPAPVSTFLTSVWMRTAARICPRSDHLLQLSFVLKYQAPLPLRTVVRLATVQSSQRPLQVAVTLAVVLLLAYATGVAAYGLRDRFVAADYHMPEEVAVFWEAWSYVEDHLYGPIPPVRERTYGALRASLDLLDSHTRFVEPAAEELESDALKGVYGGIGAAIHRDSAGRVLLAPYADSPADRAGIRDGDILIAVDHQPVVSSTTGTAIEARLRGEVGTDVVLSISRPPAEAVDLVVTRETIEVPSVEWTMATPDVGYVRLERFTERTSNELADALEQLDEAGASALVMDLRGNRGGLLGAAVSVAAQFLERGTVVFHQTSLEQERSVTTESQGNIDLPLIVLINKETASAAEVVAGALQDQKRALLVGESSYGKGSVQEIYELSDGSSLRITSALWLTPDRHRIEKKGLTPDVVTVAGGAPGDAQLDRAVAYLESGS